MKKDEKVAVYRDNKRFDGILKKTNGLIAVVEINGKTFVGRIVNKWIEL